ncbi:hypothetical protein PIB30_064413 [Stylosanthes scabra]|uniref:Uncharacterized protein n=1 Tax=Stylosanthes scabra TaxID=79078 RepID=A0ABU6XJL7_9FABA|nr:hypothetical protein [Stylosanthes scabra]
MAWRREREAVAAAREEQVVMNLARRLRLWWRECRRMKAWIWRSVEEVVVFRWRSYQIYLAIVVEMTEIFSGADLQALLSYGQLAVVVHQVLDNFDASVPEKNKRTEICVEADFHSSL